MFYLEANVSSEGLRDLRGTETGSIFHFTILLSPVIFYLCELTQQYIPEEHTAVSFYSHRNRCRRGQYYSCGDVNWSTAVYRFLA